MKTSATTTTTIAIAWPCGGDFLSDEPCDWNEMHHYANFGEGDPRNGKHMCPTGFMFCHVHGGTGTISGPGACQRWEA